MFAETCHKVSASAVAKRALCRRVVGAEWFVVKQKVKYRVPVQVQAPIVRFIGFENLLFAIYRTTIAVHAAPPRMRKRPQTEAPQPQLVAVPAVANRLAIECEIDLIEGELFCPGGGAPLFGVFN